MSGNIRKIVSPISRSAAKLSLPPSREFQTRAECATPTSSWGGGILSLFGELPRTVRTSVFGTNSGRIHRKRVHWDGSRQPNMPASRVSVDGRERQVIPGFALPWLLRSSAYLIHESRQSGPRNRVTTPVFRLFGAGIISVAAGRPDGSPVQVWQCD